MGSYIKYIFSEKGLTTGEDDDGSTHLPDLVQKPEGGLGIQFIVIGMIFCNRPAVFTIKIASPGGFPCNQADGIVFSRMTWVAWFAMPGFLGTVLANGMWVIHYEFNSLATSMAE
jgi:hypothetical protein